MVFVFYLTLCNRYELRKMQAILQPTVMQPTFMETKAKQP